MSSAKILGPALDRALTGSFVLSGAKDGSGKFSKEIDKNQPVNKYDEILNNKIIPAKDDFMGDTNVLANGDKMASNLINELFAEKLAEEENIVSEDNHNYEINKSKPYVKSYNKPYNKPRNNASPYPRNNNNTKNHSNYNSYDKDDQGNDYLPYAILGSVAVGLGAYQAYKTKNISAPLNSIREGAKKGFQKGLLSAPKKILKSNKTSSMFLNAVKESDKSLKNLEGKGNFQNRFAEEIIEEMYKGAMDTSKSNYLKTLVKEDFVQNGIRSIPYMTVPIGLSYALNKNLKQDNNAVRGINKDNITPNDRIIIDVPLSEINKRSKKASCEINEIFKIAQEIKPPREMKEWAKHQLPREMVRASSWALFPSAVIAMTHRNIRGMGEKIDSKNKKLAPIEAGKARIIIEAGPPQNNYDYKIASQTIDRLYKQAVDEVAQSEKGIMELTGEKKPTEIPLTKERLTNNEKEEEDKIKG